MSALTYSLPDRQVRRVAERASGELLRLLRMHHPDTDVADAEDAHAAALRLVRGARQRREAAHAVALRDYFTAARPNPTAMALLPAGRRDLMTT
jgi:hypothetical protein